MSFPTYTRADLSARVLARLAEVGVGTAAGSSGGFAAGSYTQAQVIDRALARLGEVGFDLAQSAARQPYTLDDLVTRVLARLGETGFDLTPPTDVAGYTPAEIADRVLAKLGETGFDIAANVVPPTIGLTFNGLAERALVRLGEVGFGQAAEPEALARMTALAPQVLAELVKNRVYLPIVEPIPAEAFDALASILASRSSSDFGLGNDELTLLAQRAQAAEAILRRFVFEMQRRVNEAIPILLAEMSRDRLLSFPFTGTLLAETGDAATTIIASRMAGEFGLPADRVQVLTVDAQAATAKLRRLAFGFQAKVQAAVPGILAELAADHLASFADAGHIAPELMDAVSAIAASRLVDDFQLAADRAQILVAEAQAAITKLRRLAYHFQQRVTGALPSILAELTNARAYTFPADGSVPAETADALSDVLSARMAQDFGLDAGRAQMLLAEGEAARKRLILLGLPGRVASVVPAILAELYTDKVYAFPADDVIRPDAFDGLAAICSARLAMDVAPERAPILIQEAQMAEARLRRMRAHTAPSEALRVSYF